MSDQTDSAKRADLQSGKSVRRHAAAQRSSPSKRDPRFRQLLDKAREGDETAVHGLWVEFQFDFNREGGRDDLD